MSGERTGDNIAEQLKKFHQPPIWQSSSGGMSLRDWFAGLAMQGDWANQACGSQFGYINCAIEYYKMADAMLEARNQNAKGTQEP
jgi:hypothetical protein